MNSAQTFHSTFSRGRLTKNESTKRAFSLSLAAHLGLLAFLVIGISWNNSTPSGVEVELWDASQQVETPVVPEIKTEMKEEAADIAIKKKKVEKEKPKKAEAPKPAALTPAQIKANAEADKRREANIASLRGMAAKDGGTGGSVGSGVGAGGTAPPGWSDKVIKKVRANITFNADSFKGNKQTIVQVKLAPDGAILMRVMTSSSDDNAWDQAVLSAIDATQSLPKDDNGQFPTLTPELKLKPK
ncbi:cell envelope integrity protein TolA [Polynucleobacter necessarius]|uniref:cell envelope integrity protein TolA n=1 Tax=Polynucleobacter necessarius TaxID=576610 RepID=UPI000E09184E|nr:cell envelope integrity protein TolA [Polynucleobacter necessarius]